MGVVGDYFSFQNGYAFKSKDFVKNGKYAIIRIKELKDGSVKFFTDTARVNPEDGFNVNKYIVKKGDALVEFDKKAIESEGYDTTITVLVTNTQEFLDVVPVGQKELESGQTLFTIV